jgi:hypothetical protein
LCPEKLKIPDKWYGFESLGSPLNTVVQLMSFKLAKDKNAVSSVDPQNIKHT